jgi:enoyl-CoA hydratase/carnithine racemase
MNAQTIVTETEPLLLWRQDGGVLHLTLNRPQQSNALSKQMLAALREAFIRVGEDASVRAVVLGASGRAYCAGHDLRQISENMRLDYLQGLFADCSRVMGQIRRLPQPVIARVQGVATAGGCQLVASCDLAVAAETARFAASGIDIGLFCATPAVPLSRNIGQKQAFEMLVTGEFIDARTALERGLVNRVVPAAELDAEIGRLTASILAKPAQALAAGKSLFYRQREMGVEAAYQLAVQVMAGNALDPDAQEGVAAFLEKRPPDWR